MRLIRTPEIFKLLLPSAIWQFPRAIKKLYLTFDDGPIPEATPYVLEELQKVEALATFFCVGDNVTKHPNIFHSVKEAGHATGIHTYNHLNGWKTNLKFYLENIEKCTHENDSILFRPPYGMLSYKQYLSIKEKYKIIYWDVVSYDFDLSFSSKDCYEACVRNVRAGSIVVFHDSLKSLPTLRKILPKLLQYWKNEGYEFAKIEQSKLHSHCL